MCKRNNRCLSKTKGSIVMFNKFRYLFLKLCIEFIKKSRIFKKTGCALTSSSFSFKVNSLKSSSRVAVVFFDSKITHIGDQIFFDTLIQNLCISFDHVDIISTNAMKGYFKFFGHNVIDKLDFDPSKYDLMITRIEELFNFKNFTKFDNFKNHKSKTIFINTVEKSIQDRITVEIVRSVYQCIRVEPPNINLIPRAPSGLFQESALDENKEYLIYSNYVDSGWFRIGKNDRKLLQDCAIKLAKEHGFTILHVGTLKDKDNDTQTIPFSFSDYIDLRGCTTVEQLFSLCQLKNVKVCVTFDTFVFHAASFSHTKCYVRMKKSSTAKLDYLFRCIVPCVNPNSLFLEVLTHSNYSES